MEGRTSSCARGGDLKCLHEKKHRIRSLDTWKSHFIMGREEKRMDLAVQPKNWIHISLCNKTKS